MRLIAPTCLMLALAALAAAPARAYDESTEPHEYCSNNIPPDESKGFVPLPEGDVFCPLLADPKAAHSYVAYVRGTGPSPLATDLLSVGIGDHFGIARWNGPSPGNGIQFGLEGSVFAQFDLNTESYDLINADYLVGLPITYRYGWFSGRARVFHQSSHLGDEFLLHSRIQRQNFSFEAAEVILSGDAGPARIYAGAEYLIHMLPEKLEDYVLHGGVELRQRKGALPLGSFSSARFVAAGDVKALQDPDWETAVSAEAGLEFSSPHDSGHAARVWSVLGHYYTGPSPYGQFYKSDVTYYGVGLHFAL
jgi:hypothetical protein